MVAAFYVSTVVLCVGCTAEEEVSEELLGVCVSELSGAWLLLSLLSGLVVSSSGVIRLSGTVTVAGVVFAILLYIAVPPRAKRLSPSRMARTMMIILIFFFRSASAHSFT